MNAECTAQKGVELNLPTGGTGIPWNDKRAHARDVSLLLILSFLKLPVFQSRFKAKLQYFVRSVAKLHY